MVLDSKGSLSIFARLFEDCLSTDIISCYRFSSYQAFVVRQIVSLGIGEAGQVFAALDLETFHFLALSHR